MRKGEAKDEDVGAFQNGTRAAYQQHNLEIITHYLPLVYHYLVGTSAVPTSSSRSLREESLRVRVRCLDRRLA
jgi:hypothetical protein